MSDHSKETHSGEAKLYGLLAEIEGPEALVEAARRVRDAGYSKWDCYSPFPVHGIDPAMGIKRTILPWIVFVAGLTGCGLGLLLQWWTNSYDYKWIVSGKPLFSLPANIPITFETTILLSVFAAFFGMWALNRLPQPWHPLFRSDRFTRSTQDGFFVAIEAGDPKFDELRTRELLEGQGLVAIDPVYLDPDPGKKQIPKLVMGFIIVSSAVALVPFALVAKARSEKPRQPHYHIFAGMDFQPKGTAQGINEFFPDHRVTRPQPEGTVARDRLQIEDDFYRGIGPGGTWLNRFPPQLELDKETMDRGQDQYDIYCGACHGMDGKGTGMVHARAMKVPNKGWVQPTDITLEMVVRQPHGQLFNTITHGIRNMPAYGPQIAEKDRWAIVLYVRALQRAANAGLDEVPEDLRRQIR
jgi:mono/diheme cytochrome c family protein